MTDTEPERWRTDINPNPQYSPDDWRYEVANGDTELGYHEWVERRENDRRFHAVIAARDADLD